MRQTILALAGASSLLFGATSAAVLNMNDGTRALKRADDMTDTTPMTSEEGNRLRSLMESGRLRVHRHGELESLPEVKVQNSLRSRVLGKHPSHSSPRSNPTTRAAPNHRSHANTVGRKAPQPQPRQQGDDFTFGDDVVTDDVVTDDVAVGSGVVGMVDEQPVAVVDDQPVAYGDDQPTMAIDDQPVAVESEGPGPGFPVGGELRYISIYLEGFQDGQVLVEAIPPNPDFPNEFDAGSRYVYDKEPIYGIAVDHTSTIKNSTAMTVDPTDVYATVSGQCIRTDPYDELDDANYLGRAYCHFVYTFAGLTDEVVAEGPVDIGQPAALTVTGGAGIYRRTVGEVILNVVDTDAFPEVFPSFGDLPASYYVQAFLYMDEALVPSEVFSS